MKDRIPGTPGRVLITPEGGSAAFYATMARADNPIQEGDPLNKATFLTDETAALFGLSASAVPNNVFALIGNESQNFNGYSSDLYQFITGQHLLVRMSQANNYDTLHFENTFRKMKESLTRELELSGNKETITIYDGGNL